MEEPQETPKPILLGYSTDGNTRWVAAWRQHGEPSEHCYDIRKEEKRENKDALENSITYWEIRGWFPEFKMNFTKFEVEDVTSRIERLLNLYKAKEIEAQFHGRNVQPLDLHKLLTKP